MDNNNINYTEVCKLEDGEESYFFLNIIPKNNSRNIYFPITSITFEPQIPKENLPDKKDS